MSRTYLSIYLQDHLAGATAGVNLARRASKHNEGTPTGRRLEQIAHEIEADRDTLAGFMSELDVPSSWAKIGAAWMTERLSRLKPNGRGRGDTQLLRMHELETLSLGIAGKQSLWEALRMSPQSAAIANLDLDDLHERARSQRERVEMERIALAREALSLSPQTPTRHLEQARGGPAGD
jgi:hypothetical protein